MAQQKTIPCPAHEACTAIYLPADPGQPGFEFNGGRVAWVSHAHSDLHVGCRNNERNAACQDCVDHPGWPANQVGNPTG